MPCSKPKQPAAQAGLHIELTRAAGNCAQCAWARHLRPYPYHPPSAPACIKSVVCVNGIGNILDTVKQDPQQNS